MADACNAGISHGMSFLEEMLIELSNTMQGLHGIRKFDKHFMQALLGIRKFDKHFLA